MRYNAAQCDDVRRQVPKERVVGFTRTRNCVPTRTPTGPVLAATACNAVRSTCANRH
ncbi:hypothetical protein PUN28_010655 [Cardiocondyla obscurior]|uniref:Uncharacterized protein n=1 Tax=Cardiocondyla obscurior TaxID=286306 RepID=A0AAW2FKI6_9HYME